MRSFSHFIRPCVLLSMTLVLLVCGVSIPPRPTVAHSILADNAKHKIYLPNVLRIAGVRGFVTTPAELKATKLLADQGQEASAKAVRMLLRQADEGMAFALCAPAVYTTKAGDKCLNPSAQYTFALAIAYHMTADLTYATKAAAIVRSWYTNLQTINDTSDDQPQLDWSRWMPAMIWGADLLEGSPVWTSDDRQQFRSMLVNKVLIEAQRAAERTNNWADAGNVLRITIALYTGLPNEQTAAIASWKLKLDGVQANGSWVHGMLENGSLADENNRGTSGLGYNQVALSSKTVFAEILRRNGDGSLYTYKTPRGVTLKNGWDFLASQVVSAEGGICTWPYTDDGCVGYSNKSGWELAYAYWHEPAYLGPILLARPYGWSDWSDPGYGTILFSNLQVN